MPGLSHKDLESLIALRAGWCVSVYLPTERASGDPRQNPIRLKNLLSRAVEELAARGVGRRDAEDLLSPAAALLDDSLFWQAQSDGLALFAGDGYFQGYRQPLPFVELVVVAHRFHVKPLLPLLSGDGRFYVLALSQAEVRVLTGTRHSIQTLELDHVPSSLADALKYDEVEKEHQFHTVISGGPRGWSVFHGHGEGDDSKDRILRYFRRIDQGLNELLARSTAPLVIAGVEYLHAIYGEANTYPHLLNEGVRGNVEELSAAELHETAWSVVGPHFAAAQKTAADRFGELVGKGKASSDLATVLAAATQGRVDVLFVNVEGYRWGSFDESSGGLHEAGSPAAEDYDLLDQAAVRTLRTAGTVYAVAADAVPGGGDVAAVFRY